jgi:hypothetical protein
MGKVCKGRAVVRRRRRRGRRRSNRRRYVGNGQRGWVHTFASDGPKTSTLLTCSSWLWEAPGEATQEPVRRTAAPTARLGVGTSSGVSGGGYSGTGEEWEREGEVRERRA